MYHERPDYLFAEDYDCLGALAHEAIMKVRQEPDDELLDCDPDWLVSTIMVNIEAEPVALNVEGATRDEPQEINVNVTGNPRYALFDEDDGNVPGLLHRVKYPFTGFAPLLRRRPSTWYSMYPRGRVEDKTIVFEYRIAGYEHAEELKRNHEQNLDIFGKFLENANSDLKNFLGQLPAKLTAEIELRREEVTAKKAAGDALGIPLEKRDDTEPRTADLIELREVVPKPGDRKQRDPVSMAEFDGILHVVETAGRNFERHPRITVGWGEDEFRDVTNSYLNLIYAKTGSVTGETFIRAGKSDILIRDQDVDVFIAECKIWGGKARVHSDMDQLFERYLTWRATKAALLYFNRGKNITVAMEELKGQVAAHPCHVSTEKARNETHLRFKFQHPSDEKRNFDFAILMIPVQT